ncbi:PRC-barrel domain-containing protein [Leptolyngbya sp. 15MV]|nr:PRC-barrel domain-containing protein [Leptolyngbya sp. 15MV]
MSDYPTQGGRRMDGDVERDETNDLISSEKVEGTTVYSRDGNSLGSIHSVMIGKRDGQVAYAVVSFGGFLGLGQSYFPVPWSQLTYDPRYDGYVTDLTEDRLRGAPQYGTGTGADWNEPSWRSRVA